MPIIVTLDEVLQRKGMTLTQLSEAIDLTLANLSILKTGKAKAVRFTTLEAICEVLDCQPGEILTYRSGEGPGQ
ncbi:helix-turn-helix domain-containing protein [Sphingomonas sp. MMS12-HWE2-04]|uniref:helix-turn-helix domain-containing protein n=1 Tax=Sphingomonas sp. MMS12-HWE2-04 TaxID=3234199 RepID=UPI00384EDA67